MFSTLTTAYMAGDVERELLESKAAKQRLIDEARATGQIDSRTGRMRHRIASLLMSAGARLDDRPAPAYRHGLDDSLNPAP